LLKMTAATLDGSAGEGRDESLIGNPIYLSN
jgi:hypothetical protein